MFKPLSFCLILICLAGAFTSFFKQDINSLIAFMMALIFLVTNIFLYNELEIVSAESKLLEIENEMLQDRLARQRMAAEVAGEEQKINLI